MHRLDPHLADHLVRLHIDQLLDEAEARRRLPAERQPRPSLTRSRTPRRWAGTILVRGSRRLVGRTATGQAVLDATPPIRGAETGV